MQRIILCACYNYCPNIFPSQTRDIIITQIYLGVRPDNQCNGSIVRTIAQFGTGPSVVAFADCLSHTVSRIYQELRQCRRQTFSILGSFWEIAIENTEEGYSMTKISFNIYVVNCSIKGLDRAACNFSVDRYHCLRLQSNFENENLDEQKKRERRNNNQWA